MPHITRKLPTALLTAAFLGGCSTYQADHTSLSGEQVYQQTCIVCHGTGLNEAPRYQDKIAWKKLVEEGQVILSAHGWVGVRGMPPQGGNPNLSLVEFSRGVTYMGRGVGADWQYPDAAMLAEIEKEIVLRRKELAEKTH